MAATNQNTPKPADNEMVIYVVTIDPETAELVARTSWGQELARTGGDSNEDHADLAAKAAETLVSWYN